MIRLLIVFLSIGLSLCSCYTMSSKMTVKKTENLMKDLLLLNGNSFSTSSTYIIESYVWTYRDEQINIYKVSKGRVAHKEIIEIERSLSWLKNFNDNQKLELNDCIVLGGDMLKFKINIQGKVIHDTIPIDIKCFTKQRYNSLFFNIISSDINEFSLTW